MCGEGMPNYYAKEILANSENICFNKWVDMILGDWLHIYDMIDVCRSMDYYNMAKDKLGNPTHEDCVKSEPFPMYYVTKESNTLFKGYYHNKR